MARKKVSAALRDFEREINSLIDLDRSNQKREKISNRQLKFLTEGVFLAGFRAFENYVEEIFILYTLGKASISGRTVRSYLRPKNFNHSRDLLKSTMQFLDWSSADVVIDRSERCLQDGSPIYTGLSIRRRELLDMKTIRNQIAHNSLESHQKYQQMLLRLYGTIPLRYQQPGDHLLKIVNGINPPRHYLCHYLNILQNVGRFIAY